MPIFPDILIHVLCNDRTIQCPVRKVYFTVHSGTMMLCMAYICQQYILELIDGHWQMKRAHTRAFRRDAARALPRPMLLLGFVLRLMLQMRDGQCLCDAGICMVWKQFPYRKSNTRDYSGVRRMVGANINIYLIGTRLMPQRRIFGNI